MYERPALARHFEFFLLPQGIRLIGVVGSGDCADCKMLIDASEFQGGSAFPVGQDLPVKYLIVFIHQNGDKLQ